MNNPGHAGTPPVGMLSDKCEPMARNWYTDELFLFGGGVGRLVSSRIRDSSVPFLMSVGASIEASGSTSHTLLQRVRRQEPAAWERFTRIYGPLVYRWCAVAGLKPHDSADVMQEVFQAVFQGIDRFDNRQSGQSLRGWLWTIARNKICDHFRRRRTGPIAAGGTAAGELLNEAAADSVPADEPPSDHAAELAHRALTLIQTEFETTTWQAFWAMAVDGLSAAEAAQKLGLTTAAVFKAKSRVLNRLRRELDGLLD